MLSSVLQKLAFTFASSAMVRSHSSSWPSSMRACTISLTIVSMREAFGFSSVREALSTASASEMMAASLNCGLGPG